MSALRRCKADTSDSLNRYIKLAQIWQMRGYNWASNGIEEDAANRASVAIPPTRAGAVVCGLNACLGGLRRSSIFASRIFIGPIDQSISLQSFGAALSGWCSQIHIQHPPT